MATLNNESVAIGDNLYDIITEQSYTVAAVTNSNITLGVNGTHVLFETEGVRNGVTRLFWHNPVLFIPTKNDLDNIILLKNIYGVM